MSEQEAHPQHRRPDTLDDIDLTVLVLATVWSEDAHRRTLESIQTLMAHSGLRAQALLVEMLPPGTDVNLLAQRPTDRLPMVWQQALEQEGFDYLCEYGATARGLRRAVRSARGHHVCLLREGDEIGFRCHADRRVQRRDADLLVAVSAGAPGGLAAHRAMAGGWQQGRGLAALVATLGAYDGALLLRRDYLDDLLGQVGYDANPGYIGYLTEVVTIAALRDAARIQFTEQIAVFPHEYHHRVHRERVAGYVLHCLPVRRAEVGPRWEPRTESLIDATLATLRDLTSGQPSPATLRPAAQDRSRLAEGAMTDGLRAALQWLVGQLRRQWDWLPDGNTVAVPFDDCPAIEPATNTPRVSLVTSAFKGQHVAHSFLSNLLASQGSDQLECLLVTPQPNLVQDLVFEAFALAWPQVKVMPLDHDPGIYACWNVAIEAARGRYVGNANLDDRRDHRHVTALADLLDQSGADVASAAVAITHDLAEITGFAGDAIDLAKRQNLEIWYGQLADAPPQARALRDFFLFGPQGEVTQCMNFPHCMPLWRRDLHERYGRFDEPRHGTYADFALWLQAVSQGARFLHDPRPLGLYYVDPQSHNRRNSDAVTWDAIVRRFLPEGTRIHAPEHVRLETSQLQLPPAPAGGVKFNFGRQLAQNYGNHRAGWSYVMQAFEDFHDPASPVYCNTFVEKRFVWGSDAGDGGCGPVAPHLDPWVGFVHVPPHVPVWFQFEQSNEQVFRKESWQRSLRHCRGLFVLTEYHRQALLRALRPAFPISVLHHPTEFVDEGFSLDAFDANPNKRLVQIGWWLRKLQAAHYLQVDGYTPTLLGRSDWTKNLLAYAERRYHGIEHLPTVDTIDFLDNAAYDRLLTENLVFIDFYDTSANNAVIECIARATPIVVCRHPAVEEYVGRDYPLFYDRVDQIARLVGDRSRIAAAHAWLQRPELRERLTLDHFRRSLAQSEVMRSLS